MTNFFINSTNIEIAAGMFSKMMLAHKLTRNIILVWLIFLPQQVLANQQESPHDWRVELETGIANDSIIVVDEIDNITSEGGDSAKLYASARYRYLASDDMQYSAAYSFSTKNYRHSSELDTKLHILSGSFRHKWQRFSGGVRAHYIEAELGNKDFLQIEQVSPYVSFFLNKFWYMDLSYRRANKEVFTDEGRSGSSDMLSADIYYFLQGTRHYWQFGGKYRQEETDNAQFTYDEQQLHLSYLYTFPVYGWDHELKLAYLYQRRDYDEVVDPLITDFRLDKRDEWEVELTSNFTERFTTTLLYSRSENDSNNPQQIYQQNALSLMFNYHF
ncbi:MAG: surface lipoprotein assembly modifier [Aestuariibacter sp.]